MKKILLTISRGSIARNLLQNDFYTRLSERYEIIMLTPAASDTEFIDLFSRPGVRFVEMQEVEHTKGDEILFFFHKNLIYNTTVAQKNRWGTIGTNLKDKPTYLSYLIKKIIFLPLSKLRFLRDIARYLDAILLQKKEVGHFSDIIRAEKPDVVIATNISADTEIALIKAARLAGIPTIGMPKSWDNLSKHGFRAKADTLIVWNEFMKEQAVRFQNYRPDQIVVIGIPQFDYYLDRSRIWSREKFCSLYGLDPKKKIIMFGSEGKKFPTDGDIASIIWESIESGKYKTPCQLLVRPHYGYKKDEQKFQAVFGKIGVVVDRFNRPSAFFRDEWDYSREFMDRFLNTLYHSDITVSTCSTLALDAAAFDKPLVTIGFDGYHDKPYNESIRRWYETHYYQAIMNTGAVSRADSLQDLDNIINAYLENPGSELSEREVLRKMFVYPLDGRAGQRFAEAVESVLKEARSSV